VWPSDASLPPEPPNPVSGLQAPQRATQGLQAARAAGFGTVSVDRACAIQMAWSEEGVQPPERRP